MYRTFLASLRNLQTDRLIVWHVTTFSTLFRYIEATSIHAFLKKNKYIPKNILSSHWLLSHTTIAESMYSGERGINPVTMTIVNFRKEYWP